MKLLKKDQIRNQKLMTDSNKMEQEQDETK